MADEQLNYRIDEILRITTGLVTAVREVRQVQDNHTQKFEIIEKDVSSLKKDVAFLKKEVRINSGKLDDVIFRVIEMYNRLFDIEKQLKFFDKRLVDLEEEYQKIYSELIKLVENVEDNPEARAKVDELDLRIEKLEEKVFA
ncbi:MAG: hypothetical protein ACR2MG_09535 [Pyrinomonadaceae bacterium]